MTRSHASEKDKKSDSTKLNIQEKADHNFNLFSCLRKLIQPFEGLRVIIGIKTKGLGIYH